jgi:hypothetical protein
VRAAGAVCEVVGFDRCRSVGLPSDKYEYVSIPLTIPRTALPLAAKLPAPLGAA